MRYVGAGASHGTASLGYEGASRGGRLPPPGRAGMQRLFASDSADVPSKTSSPSDRGGGKASVVGRNSQLGKFLQCRSGSKFCHAGPPALALIGSIPANRYGGVMNSPSSLRPLFRAERGTGPQRIFPRALEGGKNRKHPRRAFGSKIFDPKSSFIAQNSSTSACKQPPAANTREVKPSSCEKSSRQGRLIVLAQPSAKIQGAGKMLGMKQLKG